MIDLKQPDTRTPAKRYLPRNARQDIIEILARGFLRYRLRQEKKLAFPLAFLGEKSDSCMDSEATFETSPRGEHDRCKF